MLEMLLDGLDIHITQDQIVVAAGVAEVIDVQGMRIDQLALACSRVAPEIKFFYKFQSSLKDIRWLLSMGIPVGVEWQGLFYDSPEDEEDEPSDETEYGHYSIITHLDDHRHQLIIVDPYRDFAFQDRIFSVDYFLNRWWDTNEIPHDDPEKVTFVNDDRLLFFVTLADSQPFDERGFKQFMSVRTLDQDRPERQFLRELYGSF